MLISSYCTCTHAQSNERTRALIDQLGNGSWLERDLASNELLNLDKDQGHEISLEELEQYLMDPTLSLEARTRLAGVCLARFLKYPKGGLGVSFGSITPGAIEVQPINNDERFPATAMLNPGDAIALIGDTMLIDSFDLRAQILSRVPGETLPATVLRNGEYLQMDLPLGSLEQLTGAARLDKPLAWRALELRWARKGIVLETPDVIGQKINTTQWMNAAFGDAIPPSPRSPKGRLTAAIVGGAHQIVTTGLTRSRRVQLWESVSNFKQKLFENRTVLLRNQVSLLKANRTVYEHQLANLEAGSSEHSIHEEYVRLVTNQIEELEKQLDQYQAIKDVERNP